jgi:phospholipid/cholesterol/gamma-HCH transport system substrate-binding protein
MKTPFLTVGIFVVVALLLMGVALFLIGDRHKAFSRHEDLYTNLNDVNGIAQGTKVRVSGFEAGQIAELQIPDRPSGKFRIKLHIDNKLHNLVREDSLVSVESDGLVGDKFLMIHSGSDSSRVAESGTTLQGQEPIELSAILAKATGVMDQANTTISDLRGRLNGTLDVVKDTVENTNGLVSDARHGKGTVGMLLNDPQTANKIKGVVDHADQAAANLNQVTVQAKQVVSDFQSRDLFAKAEDTLNNAKDASEQLSETTHQVNVTVQDALKPDAAGVGAGQNLRETLSNVNLATANLTDDTEALKHGFFFRGFFKKRGYYSLGDLTSAQYRSNSFFQNEKNKRAWLSASDVFAKDAHGNETLSEAGAMQIDQIIGAAGESASERPMVVEGYSNTGSTADQMVVSRSRALLVARYLEKRFHISAKNVGVMPLNANPPQASGKSSWDGASVVFIADSR